MNAVPPILRRILFPDCRQRCGHPKHSTHPPPLCHHVQAAEAAAAQGALEALQAQQRALDAEYAAVSRQLELEGEKEGPREDEEDEEEDEEEEDGAAGGAAGGGAGGGVGGGMPSPRPPGLPPLHGSASPRAPPAGAAFGSFDSPRPSDAAVGAAGSTPYPRGGTHTSGSGGGGGGGSGSGGGGGGGSGGGGGAGGADNASETSSGPATHTDDRALPTRDPHVPRHRGSDWGIALARLRLLADCRATLHRVLADEDLYLAADLLAGTSADPLVTADDPGTPLRPSDPQARRSPCPVLPRPPDPPVLYSPGPQIPLSYTPQAPRSPCPVHPCPLHLRQCLVCRA